MKIAILTWWTWLESDIAIRSAQTFCDNINHKYDYYILPQEMDKFLANYKKYDLAIPVFHWEYGEDWLIFWLLKSLNIKYCFSDYKTHAMCMDKTITNALAKKIWLQVPKSYLIEHISQLIKIDLQYPLIAKPNSWWSSIATYKVNNYEELEKAVNNVFNITWDLAIIQEFITWTEYSVPIIGNNDPEILPIMKVVLKKSAFFDYEEKYNSDWSNEVFWDIDETLTIRLEEDAKKVYKYLWCKWFSRAEFIANDNWVFFLEINTIPGFSNVSIFPKARKLTWRTLTQIVDKIIELGLE